VYLQCWLCLENQKNWKGMLEFDGITMYNSSHMRRRQCSRDLKRVTNGLGVHSHTEINDHRRASQVCRSAGSPSKARTAESEMFDAAQQNGEEW